MMPFVVPRNFISGCSSNSRSSCGKSAQQEVASDVVNRRFFNSKPPEASHRSKNEFLLNGEKFHRSSGMQSAASLYPKHADRLGMILASAGFLITVAAVIFYLAEPKEGYLGFIKSGNNVTRVETSHVEDFEFFKMPSMEKMIKMVRDSDSLNAKTKSHDSKTAHDDVMNMGVSPSEQESLMNKKISEVRAEKMQQEMTDQGVSSSAFASWKEFEHRSIPTNTYDQIAPGMKDDSKLR